MSEGASQIPSERAAVVVAIPAELRYVALTRVAAASLASEIDLAVDDIEELRIAVDELVTLLVEVTAAGGAVQLRYVIDDDGITIVGASEQAGSSIELDDLTRQILEAVVDEYRIGPADFSLVKRRRPAAG